VKFQLLALTLLLAGPAAAAPEIDVEEHLGRSLPADLELTDQTGAKVRLGDLFAQGKPTLLVLAWFRCPMLCDLILKSAVDALKQSGLQLGRDYRAVTVSIDPADRPGAAALKQENLLAALGRPDARADWPFLVGDEPAIARLAARLGYRFARDPRGGQFAHPACVTLLTPDGTIARYLYGVPLSARDLRLALVEAGEGRIGGARDRILLKCLRWDPATRRYGWAITGSLKALTVLLTAFVAGGIVLLMRREQGRAA
jgi:protein SCO1/2